MANSKSESRPPKKIRVAVLYGGRSGEHEVSLISAASVMRHLDPARYEIIPISIDKDGRWLLNDASRIESATRSLPVFKDAPQVTLSPQAEGELAGALVPLGAGTGAPRAVDVIFPVIHGTNGEDGTLQGMLELADVAYVGCGVLASAVGMDKEVAKRLVQSAGVKIVPYLSIRQAAWKSARPQLTQRVERELGMPCFVKPANSGSSVGVHKVKKLEELAAAVEDAFQYDGKVLIEKGMSPREIELSVLENPDPLGDPLVSVPGEIIPQHEFYSYEAKYLDENGAALVIPAKLETLQARQAQEIARRAFTALECEGMARVDLFLDRESGEFYFNEVNTIPGFTHISMYPKLWEASGLGYSELLNRLIELALARQERKRKLSRNFSAP